MRRVGIVGRAQGKMANAMAAAEFQGGLARPGSQPGIDQRLEPFFFP